MEIKERFFRQAYETLYDNLNKLEGGETMNPFNHHICRDGYSAALTTRPDGFKTSILVVEKCQR